MIDVVKTVVAWIVLTLVGTNLIGFVVRGLAWAPPPIDDGATDRVRDVLARECKRLSAVNTAMTLLPAAVILSQT